MFLQEAPPTIRWATPDYDQDGDVDFPDLLTCLRLWGPCGTFCCPGDIDRDGEVSGEDLILVLVWYGQYDSKRYQWCVEIP